MKEEIMKNQIQLLKNSSKKLKILRNVNNES